MDSLTIFASFPMMPLTDHLPNGDGLVAYHLIESLAKRGHRVHVATPWSALRTQPSDRIQIHVMNSGADDPRPGALSYMLWVRRIVKRVRRTEHIDLIHELNPVCCFYSLAFLGSGLPVVLGPHVSRWLNPDIDLSTSQQFYKRAKLWLKNRIVSMQHKAADGILLSTLAALDNCQRPESYANKLFLLPPCLDTEKFSPATKTPEDCSTVLFLANVVARKGIFELLNAFSILASHMTQVKLLIAGDGPDLPAVKQRVAELSLGAQVTYFGHATRSQVPHLMQQCSVYCLPSHGEPFGMTAIEAMACGKPLVVTSAGGPAFMVSDSGGRRVPVRDPQSLANALEELLSQPELCHRMGQHNRAEAERMYASPVVAARLERIYNSVLSAGQIASSDRIALPDIDTYRKRITECVISSPIRVAKSHTPELEAGI